MKVWGVSLLMVTMFLLISCGSGDNNPPSSNGNNTTPKNYKCDLKADLKLKLKASAFGRQKAALGITNAPFCQFTKFEVKVYYMWVRLYDPSSQSCSEFTPVNLAEGNGINVNLVSNNLSDVLSASQLQMNNSAGNAVDSINVGLGTNVVVCGYVYTNSKLCRTSAGGIIPDDNNPPEDCSIPILENCSARPGALNTNIITIPLWVASGGRVHGHSHITLQDNETLNFVFPMDLGITLRTNVWKVIEGDASTLFIQSSTFYYKFYLKKTGSLYYTDFIRFLTDTNKMVILGQGYGSTFNQDDNNNVFNGGFKIWYNADNDTNNTEYPKFWGTNTDGSVYFYSQNSNVYCTNFFLTNSTGTLFVGGSPVNYDCIMAE